MTSTVTGLAQAPTPGGSYSPRRENRPFPSRATARGYSSCCHFLPRRLREPVCSADIRLLPGKADWRREAQSGETESGRAAGVVPWACG